MRTSRSPCKWLCRWKLHNIPKQTAFLLRRWIYTERIVYKTLYWNWDMEWWTNSVHWWEAIAELITSCRFLLVYFVMLTMLSFISYSEGLWPPQDSSEWFHVGNWDHLSQCGNIYLWWRVFDGWSEQQEMPKRWNLEWKRNNMRRFEIKDLDLNFFCTCISLILVYNSFLQPLIVGS